MKYLILIILIATTGCSTVPPMGQTEYTIEPIVVADGTVVCCKVHVFNSKDYDKLKFTMKKKANGEIEVSLDENGVEATDPGKLNAENNSKMLEAINKIIPLVK